MSDPWLVPDYVVVDGEEGVILTVMHSTVTKSQAEHDEMAEDAARLLWQDAEVRIERIRIEVTEDSPWSAGRLPPAVVYERGDLEDTFGPRPGAIDRAGVDQVDEFYGYDPAWMFGLGLIGIVALIVPFGLGGLVGGLAGFFVGRRRQRQWAPYGPPSYGPAGYVPAGYAPPQSQADPSGGPGPASPGEVPPSPWTGWPPN